MNPTHEPSVVIAGAGVIGLACAHHLNAAGFAVTLIDQGTVAGACSHANCGYICPSHVLPLTEPAALKLAFTSLFRPNAPFRIRLTLSPTRLHWFLNFARHCNQAQMLRAGHALKALLDSSLGGYRQLVADHALPCDWTERGLLYVLQSEHGYRDFAATDHFLRQHFDLAANPIAGDALPDFDSALRPGLAGAFHYPNDCMLRPDALCRAWAQHLRDRGVTICEHRALQRIESAAGRVTAIHTSTGTLPAAHFVLATGARSAAWGRQLGCRLPVQPGKGYSLTMNRPARCPQHPMLFPEHKVGVTPFTDGFRLGSMMEFAGFDRSIPPARINLLRRSAEPYLVEPHTQTVQETWCGWRPMTWDSLPIIGRSPRLANAWIATGHNMLGLSLATGTGRLLTELLRDTTPHIDPTPYSPTRFD